jgi:hypothetical protein
VIQLALHPREVFVGRPRVHRGLLFAAARRAAQALVDDRPNVWVSAERSSGAAAGGSGVNAHRREVPRGGIELDMAGAKPWSCHVRRLSLMVALGAAMFPAVTSAAGLVCLASSRDFYVSPSGSDANAGTSPAAPWKTLTKVDSAALRSGDHVHLEGGATFSEPLAPYAGMAGTSSAPIVFDTYGVGRATLAGGIYLNSVSNLLFENLDVTAADRGVFSSSRGVGARGITLRDVAISDIPLAGISSNNSADSGWLIDGVTISRTGDSGIYFVGSNFTVSRSTIADTGLRASIPFPRHGIYAAGPDPNILDNTITRFSTSGVSLRFQNGAVAGNRISHGARGVSFEDQATVAGTTRIVYNAISDVSDSGIVVARPASESFVVANNTIQAAGTYGIYFQVVPELTIANNIVDVTSSRAALLDVRAPTASYREHNNLWHSVSAMPFYFDGSVRTFSGYRRVSGRGFSDQQVDPLLGRDLVPGRRSPAIDAGSRTVDVSLNYDAGCDGQRFHYCGMAPDLGSNEYPRKRASFGSPGRRA